MIKAITQPGRPSPKPFSLLPGACSSHTGLHWFLKHKPFPTAGPSPGSLNVEGSLVPLHWHPVTHSLKSGNCHSGFRFPLRCILSRKPSLTILRTSPPHPSVALPVLCRSPLPSFQWLVEWIPYTALLSRSSEGRADARCVHHCIPNPRHRAWNLEGAQQQWIDRSTGEWINDKANDLMKIKGQTGVWYICDAQGDGKSGELCLWHKFETIRHKKHPRVKADENNTVEHDTKPKNFQEFWVLYHAPR